MNECTRTQDRLNDLLDGLLSARDCIRLSEHLQGCRTCRDEFDALRQTVRMVRHAPVPPDDGARERVMRRFRTAALAMQPRPRQWAAPRLVPVGLGATLAAIFTLAMFAHVQLPGRNGAYTTSGAAASATSVEPLPTPAELDRLTARHAESSAAVLGFNDEEQLDAIADASSRIDDTGDHLQP